MIVGGYTNFILTLLEFMNHIPVYPLHCIHTAQFYILSSSEIGADEDVNYSFVVILRNIRKY